MVGAQVTDEAKYAVAMDCANLCAVRRQKYRNAKGESPYHVQALAAKGWFDGVREGTLPLDDSQPVEPYALQSWVQGSPVVSQANPYPNRRI